MFPLPVNQPKHEQLDKAITINTESWNSASQNSKMLQVIPTTLQEYHVAGLKMAALAHFALLATRQDTGSFRNFRAAEEKHLVSILRF